METRTANPAQRIALILTLGLGFTVLLVGLLAGPGLARPTWSGFEGPAALPEKETLAPSSVITVTSITDDLTENGNCTLREAIQAANTDTAVDACPAGSGEDVIVLVYFTHYLSLTGVGEDNNATGDLDISSSLSIVGNTPGSFRNIRADGIDRVLHLTTGGITVTLTDIGLLDGFVSGQGGGIYVADNANLNISGSQISDNGATVSGGGMYIGSGSQVAFFDSSMVENYVTGEWYNNGGAIDNRGNLHIELGRLVRNTADGVGGAIYSGLNSTLNILDSAIHENISNRVDGLGGGGVFIDTNATANVANTTLYLNTANYHGGAVLNRGTLNFTNNTVHLNYADADANNTGDGGGVGLIDTGTFTLKNNLIAGNFDQSPGSEKPDITGPLTSAGYNLIGNRGTETFIPAIGDLVGTSGSPIDPLLSNTPAESPAYLATLVGSPAIDQIPPAYCTFISSGTNPLFSNGTSVPNDVRGVLRPQGANCDIGNYEAEANPSISKDLDFNGPTSGQIINYTITVSNNGVLTLTDGVVSDPIPSGLVLAGPISLNPSSAGNVGSPPQIVTDLTVAPSSEIYITIPAQVQGSVAAGTRITNTASLTAADMTAPLSASAVLAVSECQSQIDGNPTIYATVPAAVSAAVSGDLIKIAGYCAGTEMSHGTEQLAYLDKELTLQGGHPMDFGSAPDPAAYPTILDAARDGRVFWVPTLSEVVLEDLTLQGGLVANSGGGIYVEPDAGVTMTGVSMRANEGHSGGGLLNRGHLTIADSILEDNHAASGGAIYNQGPLTITGSTIRGNSVTGTAGGIYNITSSKVVFRDTIFDDNQAAQSTGAIFNDETADLLIESCQIINNGTENYGGAIVNQNLLEIKDTLIANNSAGPGASGTGGAIANFAQMFGLIRTEILSSTIVDNVGGGHGGGIYMPNGGTLTITQSTISRNQSGGKGGGIYLANDMFYFLYGRLTLVNSTVSLNVADGDGGGIWAVPQDLTIWVSMTHVTLAGNESTNGSGGGIFSANGDADVSYENSLLAGNTAGGPGSHSDCAGSGVYTSRGYNLLGGGGSCPTVGTDLTAGSSEIFRQVLSPYLLDNGGPSPTHALLAEGPAVDAVPLAFCLPVDQRGVSRPHGPLCDIGAYEFARQLFLPVVRKNMP